MVELIGLSQPSDSPGVWFLGETVKPSLIFSSLLLIALSLLQVCLSLSFDVCMHLTLRPLSVHQYLSLSPASLSKVVAVMSFLHRGTS